jgi:ubiquinone/menaquinone biosynthesis C-methylase UbiE
MGLGDRLAPFLTEHLGGPMEKKPFMVERRRKLLAPAQGRVLEVGAGTGFNLPHYPEGISELVVTDRLDGMLKRAQKRAGKVGRSASLELAGGEDLPFEDASFDTVVASLLLCSVDDQGEVLAEIRRVLKPGGRYLFLEHVRSDDPALARKQDRYEGLWKLVAFGCHPNRETLPTIEAACDVQEVERGELPGGAPKLVRPFVLGQALKPV